MRPRAAQAGSGGRDLLGGPTVPSRSPLPSVCLVRGVMSSALTPRCAGRGAAVQMPDVTGWGHLSGLHWAGWEEGVGADGTHLSRAAEPRRRFMLSLVSSRVGPENTTTSNGACPGRPPPRLSKAPTPSKAVRVHSPPPRPAPLQRNCQAFFTCQCGRACGLMLPPLCPEGGLGQPL